MPDFTLLLGNKNYSSWSMRAGLAMAQTGAGFAEEVVPLDTMAGRFTLAKGSPSRLVPVLRHGELIVWDSLAIVEYLAERFPDAGLWPADAAARATARSVCAEMHSGFGALRSSMPMNIRASKPGRGRAEGVEADIKRVTDIWGTLRRRAADAGPYLFGAWSAADAFFAPVVTRFRTYEVPLDDTCRAYADAVMAWPAVADWAAAAEAESWAIDEADKL